LVITGDWATAPTVVKALEWLAAQLPASVEQVLFVLGNHDFYGDTHEAVQSDVQAFCASDTAGGRFVYLSSTPAGVELDATVRLVGHDGWYDMMAGLGIATDMRIGDATQIPEYQSEYGALPYYARRWSDEAVAVVIAQMTQAAADGVRRILVATHVPPWESAALYNDLPSEPQAAPWFVSVGMGEALEAWSLAHPTIDVTVLCGHTHGRARVTITPTLQCWTSGAIYGEPRVEEVCEPFMISSPLRKDARSAD